MLRRNSAFAFVLAVLGSLFLAVSPVHAHDTLISVTPDDGSEVETAPTEAVLTFSGQLMDIEPQAVVQQGDTVIDTEAVSIDGTDLIVPLPELGAGDYSIVYSVVSSDGHRIDGQTTFTVAVGAAGSEEPVTEDSETAKESAAVPGEETETGAPEDADADEDAAVEGETEEGTEEIIPISDQVEPESEDDSSGLSSVFLWGGIVIVVLGLGVIIYRAVSQRQS